MPLFTLRRAMYLTADGKIVRANMDGSGSETLVKGLKEPVGIVFLAVANETGLVWVDSATGLLGVFKLDGTNNGTEKTQLSPHFKPRGLTAAVEKNFVCVGGRSFILVTSERPGFKNTMYNSSEPINHVFTPSFKYNLSRKNDCEGKVRTYKPLCLLTPGSSRCLAEK